MNIKRGILIHNQLPEGYGAISINSGTVFHTAQPAEMVNFREYSFRPRYEEEAYVAKRDWRSLEPEEITCLQADGSRNDYNTVYLGSIPGALKSRFEQLKLAGSASREQVMNKLKQSEKHTGKLNEAVNAFLQTLAGSEPFLFHCIGINLPNIEMVACDTTQLPPGYHPQDVRYIGIHNDGTAKMTVHTAHKFGNRISINVGEEPRSFLFVNLSMIQALNMLKTKIDVKKAGINIRNMPRFFFKYFPGYPVIRVQQKPYQYYIAPTDNCFHDGSTLGNSTLDVTFVYFGAFRC